MPFDHLSHKKTQKARTIRAADLFAGAGGSSNGLIEAVSELGCDLELTAVNHWDIAVATHTKNHPTARHLCKAVDSVNPLKLFPERRIHLFVASPECTHHSNARGGKPRSEQKRADAWDWLSFFAPDFGFPTRMMAEVYGGDEATEINARTGCIQCNVASADTAFDIVLKNPQWEYLRPLKRLRPLYAELLQAKHRLRKSGELNAAGALVNNQNRLGSLIFDARWFGLEQILEIQSEINESARTQGKPEISLISDEEHARIIELINAKTYPDKWTGDEMRGDEMTDKIYRDGSDSAVDV